MRLKGRESLEGLNINIEIDTQQIPEEMISHFSITLVQSPKTVLANIRSILRPVFYTS